MFCPKTLYAHRVRAQRRPSDLLFNPVIGAICDRLALIKRPFSRVIGFCPFHLCPLLTQTPFPFPVTWNPSWDEVKEGSCDGLISLFEGHWDAHFPQTVQRLKSFLAPDGLFVAAFWGNRTLYELREVLGQVELELTERISPRVIPMIPLEEGARLLQESQLALPTADQEIFHLTYDSLYGLIRHLRAMGETNALEKRNPAFLSKHFFERANAVYHQRFGNGQNKITATFDLLVLMGWAPCSSQPQPLKRGEGRYDLGDAMGRSPLLAQKRTTLPDPSQD